MKDYVVLDLETTGFSAENNEIIEIGAWKIKDGVAVEKFCHLVKPLGVIPLDIQKITGVTSDMVADALTFDELVADLYDFCGDLPLLGHNIKFDYSFICAKGKKMGYDFTLGGRRCGICTLELSRKLLKLDNNSLSSVSSFFRIDLKSDNLAFHRAEYDAYLTKLVYDRFLYLYPISSVLNESLLDKDKRNYGKVENNDVLEF